MRWTLPIGLALVAAGLYLRSRPPGSKATTEGLTLNNKPYVVVEDDTAEAIETALKELRSDPQRDYTRLNVTTPKMSFSYRSIPDKSGCRQMTRGAVNNYWYCP